VLPAKGAPARALSRKDPPGWGSPLPVLGPTGFVGNGRSIGARLSVLRTPPATDGSIGAGAGEGKRALGCLPLRSLPLRDRLCGDAWLHGSRHTLL